MKVLNGTFKYAHCISVVTFYTQMLKQQMKPMQVKEIYLTKNRHIQWTVDWLVKDLEAWDWLYGW
jgi:hypothetical protein